MSERKDPVATGRAFRRLPCYLYVADLVGGKRVLEIGCGVGDGAAFLAGQGAARVVGVDPDPGLIDVARGRHRLVNLELRCEDPAALELEDAAFDVVFVPEGAGLLRRHAFLPELRRVLARGGTLVVTVPSADRRGAAGGLSYHEICDRLEPLFPPVRMVAQTPMVGLSLVEFAGDDTGEPDVELDASLVGLGDDPGEPTEYIAVCGGRGGAPRPFTLFELPFSDGATALGVPLPAVIAGDAGAAQSLRAEAEEAAAAATARVQELELALARASEGGRRGDEGGDLRRRLGRAMEERAAAEAKVEELRAQLADAHGEMGRLAGEAARELSDGRREVKTLRQRVLELEGKIAFAEEASGSTREQDARTTADLTPAAAAARTASVARLRPTADLTSPAARAVTSAAEAEREVDRAAAEWDASAPSPSRLIADALSAHADERRALDAELAARTAQVDELRAERDRAVAAEAAATARAAAAEARAESVTAELRAWRSRAAVAEGKVLGADLASGRQEEAEAAAARAAELEQALADERARADKAAANWRAAEAKSDEVWRRVGELQTELGALRDDSVANAARAHKAAQANLTRAMEEAGKRLISCQDQMRRAERERDRLAEELTAARAARAGDGAEPLLAEAAARLARLDEALARHVGVLDELAEQTRDLAEAASHDAAVAAAAAGAGQDAAGAGQDAAGAGQDAAGAGSGEAGAASAPVAAEPPSAVELAALDIGLEALRVRLREVVDEVRAARDAMVDRPPGEMIEIMDRLSARLGALEGGQ